MVLPLVKPLACFRTATYNRQMRQCCLVLTAYLYAMQMHSVPNNRMNIRCVDVNHSMRIQSIHTEAGYESSDRFPTQRTTSVLMLHRLFCGIRLPRSHTQNKVK